MNNKIPITDTMMSILIDYPVTAELTAIRIKFRERNVDDGRINLSYINRLLEGILFEFNHLFNPLDDGLEWSWTFDRSQGKEALIHLILSISKQDFEKIGQDLCRKLGIIGDNVAYYVVPPENGVTWAESAHMQGMDLDSVVELKSPAGTNVLVYDKKDKTT